MSFCCCFIDFSMFAAQSAATPCRWVPVAPAFAVRRVELRAHLSELLAQSLSRAAQVQPVLSIQTGSIAGSGKIDDQRLFVLLAQDSEGNFGSVGLHTALPVGDVVHHFVVDFQNHIARLQSGDCGGTASLDRANQHAMSAAERRRTQPVCGLRLSTSSPWRAERMANEGSSISGGAARAGNGGNMANACAPRTCEATDHVPRVTFTSLR